MPAPCANKDVSKPLAACSGVASLFDSRISGGFDALCGNLPGSPLHSSLLGLSTLPGLSQQGIRRIYVDAGMAGCVLGKGGTNINLIREVYPVPYPVQSL